MPSVPNQLDTHFRVAIKAAFNIDADPIVGPSQNEKFGDYQCNAAMGLAKQLKSNPRAVAEQIKSKLELGEMASEVSIAGPGFINVTLSPRWLGKTLQELARDERLGIPRAASPQTVVVDLSGPNIAKEMHIGHLRATNIGDCLARVLDFIGHTVIRQNHVGDWGTGFGMLLAYLKESDAHHQAPIADLELLYKAAKQRFDADPAFATESRQCVVRLQSGAEPETSHWRRIIELSRKHLDEMYHLLGVKIGRADERGESFYNPVLPDIVKELTDKGIAVESQGAIVVWVEGYETPLIIRKSDGGFGYGTTDLAAVRFRVRELRGQRLVYVTDARQLQHFKQFSTAARRAGWIDNISFEHAPFGTIFGPDGKPFKTKEGENVKLKDVLNEAQERAMKVVAEKNPDLPEQHRGEIARAVGIGAIKYYDLVRDRITNYQFDWDKMLTLDGNTAPYLQYAYARIRSIFRKAGDRVPEAIAPLLQSPHELSLAKHILRLPEMIELVSRELKPHHLCTYLYELASKFSGFYENCPVLQSDEPTRSSRLLLCDLTARTLALGLDLLGIEHPEQM
jgi:arginyl-tRNA synthetase